MRRHRQYDRDAQERRARRDLTAWRRALACAGVALGVALTCASVGVRGAAARVAGDGGVACPAWVTAITTTTPTGPVATIEGPAGVGSTDALLTASVGGSAGPVSVTAEYSEAGSSPVCAPVRITQQSTVELVLRGLRPSTRYRFQVALESGASTTLSKAGSFVTLRPATVAEGVMVGTARVGRLGRPGALAVLNHSVGAALQLTYAGARWKVLPSRVGAHVDIAAAVAAALAATPGEQLPPLKVSVDSAALHSYVTALSQHWSHKAVQASVRLVGKHAVVAAVRPGVSVKTMLLATQIAHELATGDRELLSLGVQTTRVAATAPQKAVVVRLSSQTLTAYLNGKPVLETPVTTGRAALPTPIGSFSVLNRNSPYVFHSPWAPGSPYWYPPTPVTWAMEFYDGDFLHDDPGEPSGDFGSDSQNGYFASHGCVHIPHDAMAFLYNWLPIGAPVIIAQD